MRRVGLAFVLLALLSAPAAAETSVQVRVGSPSLELDFLFTEHYGVSSDRLRRCASVLDEDDLLIAIHLVRVSGVDFEILARWRRDGMSWDDITRRCRRDCGVYWVDLPADARVGPPYGRAHGYWRKHPKGDLHLSDDEIYSLVLVRALADHARMEPIEVIRLREGGTRPRGIASHRRDREDTAPPTPAAGHRGRGQKQKGKK